MPLVSIIIPTFNSARYLRATLDSVQAQRFRDFDVVLVDNCSTDDTVEMARSYGKYFPVTVKVERSTQAEAKNIALGLVRGDFIAFLDSDDLWGPAFLEKQIAFLQANPAFAMSHCYVEVIDEQGVVSHIRHEGRLPASGDCYRALYEHCWITLSSCLMRRSLFDGGLRFPDKPRVRAGAAEDWRLFFRIAKDHAIGLLDDVMVQYRRSSTNVSSMANWRGIPEDVPTLELVLADPVYWEEKITRKEVRTYLAQAAKSNADYWRGQGFYRRWLWFSAKAVRYRL